VTNFATLRSSRRSPATPRRAPRSALRIVYRDRGISAPDLQTGGAQLLDDPARQSCDIASRVLLDRCDNDALGLPLAARPPLNSPS
jgi:hypothetical protein